MRTRSIRPFAGALALFLLAASSGCTSVSPWERERLALDPMAAEDPPCQAFEHNNEVYREGAVGANGGKSGGGCGCT